MRIVSGMTTRQEVQKTAKDRSMATGPYPLRVTKRPVILEGSWSGGRYNTWTVGHRVIIMQSDGTEVPCCTSPHGHKARHTLIACGTARVAALNEAAGIPEEAR